MENRFCVNCGTTLAGGNFCVSCGAAAGTTGAAGGTADAATGTAVESQGGWGRDFAQPVPSHSNVARDAVHEMKLIGFRNLVPFRDWVGDKPWNIVWVRWLVGVALFPLALNFISSAAQLTFQSIAFVFGIYFALMWAGVLYFMLLPKLEFSRMAYVALFTMIFGIAVVLFIQQLPFENMLYSATESHWMPGRILGFVAGVGVLEETAKVLPVWWIFIRRQNDDGLGTIVFLGCVSGFAFGVAEAARYSISYALGLQAGKMGFGDYLTVQMLRLITLPLLHAVWCGIFSYFVALGSMNRALAKGLVLAGLVVAATLHGLYDSFSDSVFGVVLAVLSILIFIAYYRSGETLQAKLTAIASRQEPDLPSPVQEIGQA